MNIKPWFWKEGKVFFLDQRKLPFEEEYFVCESLKDCRIAIADMVVRGAPLIGLTAICGLILWLKENAEEKWEKWDQACENLGTARPTAVNLFYAIEQCRAIALSHYEQHKTFLGLYEKILNLLEEETNKLLQNHQKIACYGANELSKVYGEKPLRLMTLCNTGMLACGPMGTALGIISYLHSLGRVEMVYVSETRPWLQGSRLTSYELSKGNIPYKIIVDNASSWLMREKGVDAIFVGADRIVANGDTANKIGTSSLAIVAKHYQIPFYVAAPVNSFDMALGSGDDISIELRGEEEVLCYGGNSVSCEGSQALNPGFDITEGHLITALFCEKGMIQPVSKETIDLTFKSTAI